MAERIDKLERLSLEGVDVDAELLTDIGKLRNLKELDLTECKVDDQMLARIKQCTKLETLWLGRNQR